MPAEENNTSNIPEINDWSGTLGGKFYWEVKKRVKLRNIANDRK
jgi:hypothetical protein